MAVEPIVTVLKHFEFASALFDRVHGIEITDLPLDADYVPVEVQGGQEEIRRGRAPANSFRRSSTVAAEAASPMPAASFLASAIFPRSWTTGSTIRVGIGIALLEFGSDVPLQRRQAEAGAVVVESDFDAGQDKDNECSDGALLQTIPEFPVAGLRLGGPLPEIEAPPLGHRPRRHGERLIHERRVP